MGEESVPILDSSANPVPPATGSLIRGVGFRKAFNAIQVRLRFVVVLGVTFLIVGFWASLGNLWETVWHRLTGEHAAATTVSIDTEFFCPMCPGVVSDFPAICPVCSMDLIRRKKGEAAILPEGVVARMQLSPYRVQLAGIATTIVERRPLMHDVTVAGRLIKLPRTAAPGAANQTQADNLESESVLALECRVAPRDLLLLTQGRSAQIILERTGESAALSGTVEPPESVPALSGSAHNAIVRIRVDMSNGWTHPGMYGVARVAVPLAEIEPFASLQKAASSDASKSGFAAIPESAVVDTGDRRVVFVETMAGMFDGVEVKLGPRCGDYYPVIKGVKAGQKVAAVGAFLIDAEARLSPDLAAAYFGAARTADPAAGKATQKWQATQRAKNGAGETLSAEDWDLVKQQKICPVTEAELDSMGGPIPVEVAGRRVFICCQGCEKPLKADPQKYLAKLKK
jgi:Cu(I)/Ag(I) efflux system membrane fusion protein